MTTRPLAIVVSGFPRRSETFAVGELLALQERNRDLNARVVQATTRLDALIAKVEP